jgi:hypothetical protein
MALSGQSTPYLLGNLVLDADLIGAYLMTKAQPHRLFVRLRLLDGVILLSSFLFCNLIAWAADWCARLHLRLEPEFSIAHPTDCEKTSTWYFSCFTSDHHGLISGENSFSAKSAISVSLACCFSLYSSAGGAD